MITDLLTTAIRSARAREFLSACAMTPHRPCIIRRTQRLPSDPVLRLRGELPSLVEAARHIAVTPEE